MFISTCYVSCTVLSIGASIVNQKDIVSSFRELGNILKKKEQGFLRVYNMGPDLSRGDSKGILENILTENGKIYKDWPDMASVSSIFIKWNIQEIGYLE